MLKRRVQICESFFKDWKRDSITGVILRKKRFNSLESYWWKKGSFLRDIYFEKVKNILQVTLKMGSISLSHVEKKGSISMSHVEKKY